MLSLLLTTLIAISPNTIYVSGALSYSHRTLSGIHHTEGHDYTWDTEHSFNIIYTIFRAGYFLTPNISIGLGLYWYRYSWDRTNWEGKKYTAVNNYYSIDFLPSYTMPLGSDNILAFGELILGYGAHTYEHSEAGTITREWYPSAYGSFYGDGFRYGLRAGINYLITDSAYLTLSLAYIFSNYFSPNPDDADDEWWDIQTSGITLEIGAGIYIGSAKTQ